MQRIDMTGDDATFLRRAIALAKRSRERGGDPFGAVLVVDGVAVFESEDYSVEFSDPTWHAELGVISAYCRATKRIALDGYSLYCSTEPCVMCAGAMKWARISRVIFSVPQGLLQEHTGGIPKPSCDTIIQSGRRKAEILGPLLLEEGLQVFEDFVFVPKVERHQAMMHARESLGTVESAFVTEDE
jgi:tRNA(Arg) A34 adenosine deaminase TadA